LQQIVSLAFMCLRSSTCKVGHARISEVQPTNIDGYCTNNLDGTLSPLERKWGQERSIERGCWQITNELVSDK